MKKVIFDSDIMTTNSRTGVYSVCYVLYYDLRPRRKSSIYIPENPAEEYSINKNYNKACFAGVKNEIASYTQGGGMYCRENRKDMPIPNRMYYKMNMTDAVPPELKKTERYAWLKLCKQHGLLPDYIVPSTVIKGKVVFDISEIPPSLLYAYLCMMRAIVEYPAFVKAMVYLVNKLGMNFYAAFVYTTKLYITNCGHHIIAPSTDYRQSSKNITDMHKIEFNFMRNLRKFLETPQKFDNRHITELNKTYWRCNDTILSIPGTYSMINASDLFKPSLKKAIEAETDSEAKDYIDKLRDEPQVEIILRKKRKKQ